MSAEQLKNLQEEILEAVSKIREAVVSVESARIANSRYGLIPLKGAGSGIIVSGSGYIVTNYHVIRDSENVTVRLSDGSEAEGSVIGGDEATDVAVVKVDRHNLPHASLADSDKIKVGQVVLAVGNALGLPGDPTVSMGVVGAVGRPMPWSDFIFEGLIQTDAAINPGNSGGPLADLEGNVIGINTAMIPFAQGMGFAIPSNTVRRVMEQLLENGRVVRAFIGISGVTLEEQFSRRMGISQKSGVYVLRVSQWSPAHQAGVRRGDIIVHAGNRDIRTIRDLLEELSTHKPGDRINLAITRSGQIRETSVRLVAEGKQMEQIPE